MMLKQRQPQPAHTLEVASIPELVAELKAGRPILMCDDENRENEFDLIMPAEHATPQWTNFCIKAGGLVCVALSGAKADQLQLTTMQAQSSDPRQTAFLESVDLSISKTGISATERSATIKALAQNDGSVFSKPGHVFPLRAVDGGVLAREGHTEASVDLCKLAGLEEAAVIVELLADHGNAANSQEAMVFAKTHNLKIGTIASLKAFMEHNQPSKSLLPTPYGEFEVYGFYGDHMALVKPYTGVPLVRVHSKCVTGDVFGSQRCDCGPQLEQAMQQIAQDGGVLIYLNQEGRGIGLFNKLKAYALQDQGHDTFSANRHLGFKDDERNFAVVRTILRHLGISELRLLSNNPQKIAQVSSYATVTEVVPLRIAPNPHNIGYLKAKANLHQHNLNLKETP